MKYFQALISVLLILFVISRTNTSELFQAITQLNYMIFIYAIILFIIQITINSYRLYLIISLLEPTIRIKTVFVVYLNSIFTGLIAFGNIGEFAAKTYQLNQNKVMLSNNIAAQILDKILALSSLIFVASVAFLYSEKDILKLIGVQYSTSISLYSIIAAVFFSIIILIKKLNLITKYKTIISAIKSFTTIKAFCIAIASNIINILIAITCFAGVGVDLFTNSIILVATPIINMICAFPLFFHGWGVREMLWQLVFLNIGLHSNEAILGSFLIGVSFPISVISIILVKSLASLIYTAK